MNTTKRYYESMYIVDVTLTDEQVDSIIAKYSKLIADQGGEVRAVGRWDKRRLAYEIQGRREGLYILMFFEAEAAVAKELDRVYRISDDVFRHLITRVELEHIDTSRIDRPQPTAEAAAPTAVEAVETAEVAEEITEEAPAEAVEEAVAEEPATEPVETVEEPEAEPVEAVEAEATEEVVEEVEAVEEVAKEVEAPAEETAPEAPAEEAEAEEPVAEAESSETTEGEEPGEEAAKADKSEHEPQA